MFLWLAFHCFCYYVVVQSLRRVRLFVTPGTAARQAPLSSPGVCSNSRPLSQWCHPIISSSVAPFSSCPNLSQHQGLFQWIDSSRRMAKVLQLQPQHQSFQWNSGLISLRMDWFDLLTVQGSLKSLFQHNLKASVFQHSAFFMVHLSHLYMITGKIIALTIQTFVGKVMSLLFNMLSRFVLAFLPRSKCLLISRLQSQSVCSWFWSPRK